jgi:hypothetical protein
MSIALARLLPSALAALVGLVSLRMAMKGLGATAWLPFHERAAGIAWGALDERLRRLLLFLVRMGGLAFLVVFLVLALVPLEAAFGSGKHAVLAPLAIGLVFCLGLALLNRALHRATGAATPWRPALVAAALLALAATLAIALP